MAGMKALTNTQADQIADQSLADFTPQATELTRSEYCSDCPKRRQDCFPCRSARMMIRAYLTALVARQARLN